MTLRWLWVSCRPFDGDRVLVGTPRPSTEAKEEDAQVMKAVSLFRGEEALAATCRLLLVLAALCAAQYHRSADLLPVLDMTLGGGTTTVYKPQSLAP